MKICCTQCSKVYDYMFCLSKDKFFANLSVEMILDESITMLINVCVCLDICICVGSKFEFLFESFKIKIQNIVVVRKGCIYE